MALPRITFAWRIALSSLALPFGVACGVLPGPVHQDSGSRVSSYAVPGGQQYYLYVGSTPARTRFEVFPLDGNNPLRQFRRTWGVRAMAVDKWGDIYTADGQPDQGQIIAYAPGGTSKLLTINSPAIQAIAFDSEGDLFATNSVVVEEYAPQSSQLKRTIRIKTQGASALAFDRSGNLYVGRTGGSVEVFAPKADRPFLTIKHGLRAVYALLFGKSGNLYVANCPSCYNIQHATDSVNEYDTGTGNLIRVITSGIHSPVSMTIGERELLFVANRPFLQAGSVTVYDRRLVRTITRGVKGPDAVAIGPFGDAYVANWCGCGEKQDSVSVYSTDGSKLLRQITTDIVAPGALAIGTN